MGSRENNEQYNGEMKQGGIGREENVELVWWRWEQWSLSGAHLRFSVEDDREAYERGDGEADEWCGTLNKTPAVTHTFLGGGKRCLTKEKS